MFDVDFLSLVKTNSTALLTDVDVADYYNTMDHKSDP